MSKEIVTICRTPWTIICTKTSLWNWGLAFRKTDVSDANPLQDSALFLPLHTCVWTNKVTVRPVKTQISLASTQSDQSLCCALILVAKDPSFLYADSEDSDQTGWMPRLIWVLAGRTLILLVLLCRGSYIGTSVLRLSLFQTFFPP